MSYSLAAAAQASGVNRSTILRAIKNGKISGQRDASGAWNVEPVELHRVFPPKPTPEAVPQHAPPDAELRIRLAVAEERLGELKVRLEEMREEKNSWKAHAERLALGAPKPASPSWWSWLRSSG